MSKTRSSPANSSVPPPTASPSSSSTKPWEHAKGGAGSASDPLAARFVESLSYDTRLYDADIRGSLVHGAMLKEVGLISEEELAAIRRGLGEIRREIESAPAGSLAVGVPGAWPGWKVELEDVHMCIEAALIAKVGDAGRKLHTGRSRNDQVALDLRLWLREACEAAAAGVDGVLRALEDLAEREGEMVMPGYTHMQRAQPVCLGAEVMAWHAMLGRDRGDLLRLGRGGEGGITESPLGSGAIAGSALGLDRAATASALEFGGPGMSSIDGTASRDEALDFLYVLARCAMHLSRWAEQWIVYCTTEFGFLKLDERHTTGSSMMPQKRNPDMLELIRGRCGNVYGHLMALLAICKGLPIGYNRDLQEDKRQVFAAYDVVTDSLAMAARIVVGARFDGARVAGTLSEGYLDATSLAEYLVTVGVPFRTAHQVVGQLVRACEAPPSGRKSLDQLTLDEIRGAVRSAGQDAGKVGKDVFEWLGAEKVVERYATLGHAGRGEKGYRLALERAREARGGAGSGAPAVALSAAAPAPVEDLFNESIPATPDDARLIDAYKTVGRTLDDLPYTPEFDRIFRAVDGPAKKLGQRGVFHRLHNLRKAGRLPKVGRSTLPSSPPRIAPREEAVLRGMVTAAVGTLGQRDQLPYTEQFDKLAEEFNTKTGRGLEPHDVWRLVAKLAK